MSATHTPAAGPAEQNGQPHPPADPAEPVADRFHRLAAEWYERTKFLSDSTKRAADPTYQEIVGMGWAAVPLMLDEFRRHQYRHWFAALHWITGAEPIPDDAYGNIPRMAAAWVEWGQARGY